MAPGVDSFSSANPSWEEIEALNASAEVEHLDALRRGTANIGDPEAAEQLVDHVEGVLREVGEGRRIDTVNDVYKAQ